MDDPYATHLPILRALSKIVLLRKVLEYGAGDHSTPFFLSLPIDQLVSVEPNPFWRKRIKGDSRHSITKARRSPEGFDLVLIDDATSIDARVETISYVLSKKHPVVVIHDSEVYQYAEAIRAAARDRTTFVCIDTPHTAVVWPEGANQNHELLKALETA